MVLHYFAMIAGRSNFSLRSRLGFIAGGVLLFSSCASTGSRGKIENAVPVPAAWQQGAVSKGTLDANALTRWWERFNDPALNELILGALRSSPDVRTALSKISEYRARRGLVRAVLFPSLNGDVTGGKTRTRNRNTSVATTNESYGASLDATWQVDLFGLQKKTLDAASADFEQIREYYYGAQVSLSAEVAMAYVNLRSAEMQLSVVQHSLVTRVETVQLTQWREQAGTGNALDTQQSLSSLEQARLRYPHCS